MEIRESGLESRVRRHLASLRESLASELAVTDCFVELPAVEKRIIIAASSSETEKARSARIQHFRTEETTGLASQLLRRRISEKYPARIRVQGTGGSGKTTTLQRLAWESTSYSRQEQVCVLAYLDRYRHDSVWDFFLATKACVPLSVRDLDSLAESGRLVLLLDACDERGPRAARLFDHMDDLALRFPMIRMVIASREENECPRLFRDTLVLLPVVDETVQREFLSKYLGNEVHANAVLAALRERDIAALAQMPICLYALSELVKVLPDIAELPTTAGLIYRRLFQELYWREGSGGAIFPGKGKVDVAPKDEFESVRRILSGASFLSLAQLYESDEPDFTTWAEALRPVFGTKAREALKTMCQIPLLGRSGTKITFCHTSFRDYLAAEHILDCKHESEAGLLLERVPSWAQSSVVQYLIELESALPPPLLMACWQSDPLVVATLYPDETELRELPISSKMNPWERGLLKVLRGDCHPDDLTETHDIAGNPRAVLPLELQTRLGRRQLWSAGLTTAVGKNRMARLSCLLCSHPQPWWELHEIEELKSLVLPRNETAFRQWLSDITPIEKYLNRPREEASEDEPPFDITDPQLEDLPGLEDLFRDTPSAALLHSLIARRRRNELRLYFSTVPSWMRPKGAKVSRRVWARLWEVLLEPWNLPTAKYSIAAVPQAGKTDSFNEAAMLVLTGLLKPEDFPRQIRRLALEKATFWESLAVVSAGFLNWADFPPERFAEWVGYLAASMESSQGEAAFETVWDFWDTMKRACGDSALVSIADAMAELWHLRPGLAELLVFSPADEATIRLFDDLGGYVDYECKAMLDMLYRGAITWDVLPKETRIRLLKDVGEALLEIFPGCEHIDEAKLQLHSLPKQLRYGGVVSAMCRALGSGRMPSGDLTDQERAVFDMSEVAGFVGSAIARKEVRFDQLPSEFCEKLLSASPTDESAALWLIEAEVCSRRQVDSWVGAENPVIACCLIEKKIVSVDAWTAEQRQSWVHLDGFEIIAPELVLAGLCDWSTIPPHKIAACLSQCDRALCTMRPERMDAFLRRGEAPVLAMDSRLFTDHAPLWLACEMVKRGALRGDDFHVEGGTQRRWIDGLALEGDPKTALDAIELGVITIGDVPHAAVSAWLRRCTDPLVATKLIQVGIASPADIPAQRLTQWHREIEEHWSGFDYVTSDDGTYLYVRPRMISTACLVARVKALWETGVLARHGLVEEWLRGNVAWSYFEPIADTIATELQQVSELLTSDFVSAVSRQTWVENATPSIVFALIHCGCFAAEEFAVRKREWLESDDAKPGAWELTKLVACGVLRWDEVLKSRAEMLESDSMALLAEYLFGTSSPFHEWVLGRDNIRELCGWFAYECSPESVFRLVRTGLLSPGDIPHERKTAWIASCLPSDLIPLFKAGILILQDDLPDEVPDDLRPVLDVIEKEADARFDLAMKMLKREKIRETSIRPQKPAKEFPATASTTAVEGGGTLAVTQAGAGHQRKQTRRQHEDSGIGNLAKLKDSIRKARSVEDLLSREPHDKYKSLESMERQLRRLGKNNPRDIAAILELLRELKRRSRHST